MEDEKFYSEIAQVFENGLSHKCIKIKDLEKDVILEDLNYDRLLFDTNLNIYKIENGLIIPVDNPNFRAVVVDF